MSNYNSSHTGAEIDAAVSSVLEGGTLNTAVAEMQTAVATNTSAIEGLTDDVDAVSKQAEGDRLIVEGGTLPVDMTTSGYIASDGTVTASVQYNRSDYIPVYEGQEITFKGKASSSVCLVAAYTGRGTSSFSSAKSLVGAGTSASTSEDVSYTVPKDVKYIIISRNTAITTDISVSYPSLRDTVSELSQTVDGGEYTIANWNDGYVNTSGTITSSTQYKYSDLIPVYVGQQVAFSTQGSQSVLVLSAYDSNGDFVSASSVNTKGGSGVISVVKTITPGVSYIRVSRNKSYTAAIRIDYDGLNERFDTLSSGMAEESIKERRQPSMFAFKSTSPRKACVCFQLDWGTYAAETYKPYKALLQTYGVERSLYAVQPKLFSIAEDLAAAKELYDAGDEIALHTDSDHAAINNDSTLTVAQFNDLMATYHSEMAAQGLDYTGCVVLSTNLKSTFFPEIVKHHNWQIAGAVDYSAIGDSYASALMSLSSNYKFPKRLGIELTPTQYADPSNEVLVATRAIELINEAVENAGFLIIYGHSYMSNNVNYTIREATLTAILAHLQPLLANGKVLTGRTSELIEYYFSKRADE